MTLPAGSAEASVTAADVPDEFLRVAEVKVVSSEEPVVPANAPTVVIVSSTVKTTGVPGLTGTDTLLKVVVAAAGLLATTVEPFFRVTVLTAVTLAIVKVASVTVKLS